MTTSQKYSEKISILQQLMKKEKELKIAIAHEKLKNEQPVLLDKDILNKKIAEYQRLLEEARNEYKMKNVMCQNLQLASILQRIVGKPNAVSAQKGFSDFQRKYIKDLLQKKKELNRLISVKRKEIAETDEDVLRLEADVSTDKETSTTSAKLDDLEELERLKRNSKKVVERVHLLSNIIQSLISHIEQQDDSDLLDLMEECKAVSKCHLDNLNDIKVLFKSVCSINL